MKKRLFVYDLVRVAAILGVVATHTEAITASPTNYLGGLSWWFANTIHSLVSISVPLFVLLSGALILQKPKVTQEYVISKVWGQFILPLLIWFLLYSWWETYRLKGMWNLGELIKNLFFVNIGHLYFLPMIVGLYCVMPMLQQFLKTTLRYQQYVLLAGVTLLSICYKYLSFLVLKTYNSTNILLIFLPFVSYPLWGYFLAKVKLNRHQWLWLTAGATVLTAIISIASYLNTLALVQGKTLFWSPSGGNLVWEPLTVPIFLLSTMVFVLLLNLHAILPSTKVPKLVIQSIQSLAKASFGIYLIHPFIMEQIDHIFHLSIQFVSYPLWIYYLQRTTYVFTTSAVVVLLILKIPYLKNIFGLEKQKFVTK